MQGRPRSLTKHITPPPPKKKKKQTGSALLIGTIIVTGEGLAAWKQSTIKEAEAAAANQPEPIEMISAAVATSREHRQTSTSIGTVLALRSVELRNELSGTVRHVALTPGQVVEAGTVLVALDVSVEQAELKALEAQAALTETVLARVQRLFDERAEAQTALDRRAPSATSRSRRSRGRKPSSRARRFARRSVRASASPMCIPVNTSRAPCSPRSKASRKPRTWISR